jgi:hypothetical protein
VDALDGSDMQWTYAVVGTLPTYVPPTGEGSRFGLAATLARSSTFSLGGGVMSASRFAAVSASAAGSRGYGRPHTGGSGVAGGATRSGFAGSFGASASSLQVPVSPLRVPGGSAGVLASAGARTLGGGGAAAGGASGYGGWAGGQ